MSFDWRVADMLGFLRSWSACKRYETQVGSARGLAPGHQGQSAEYTVRIVGQPLGLFDCPDTPKTFRERYCLLCCLRRLVARRSMGFWPE